MGKHNNAAFYTIMRVTHLQQRALAGFRRREIFSIFHLAEIFARKENKQTNCFTARRSKFES